MEIIDPSQINYAEYNPRIMSAHDAKSLDASMTTFGDISGITRNVQTNNYVTGHQRMRTLQKRFPGKVKIQVEKQEPDEFHTVGWGFVVVEGTSLKFPYRQVDWSIATEKTANIAANRVEADWNKEMLAQLNQEIVGYDNGADLLALTGQTQDEIDALNQLGSEPEKEPSPHDELDAQRFRFTAEQTEIIDEAIGHVLAKHVVTSDNMDIRANAIWFICRDYLDRLHGLTGTENAEEEFKTA